ncbi:DEKNAAC102462 [Brettanomyces naardenensis]|uniref:DEKNAAC102462 n=1 Tax=Brettanomyces naardenensis TaxID=13370 RepID=A0A448YKM3_BRENA|nr:DEKNAAC102462 [Brettanomyces naardenensis]
MSDSDNGNQPGSRRQPSPPAVRRNWGHTRRQHGVARPQAGGDAAADNDPSAPNEEISDAMGPVHHEATICSSSTSSEAGSAGNLSDLIYDHRPHGGMTSEKTSHSFKNVISAGSTPQAPAIRGSTSFTSKKAPRKQRKSNIPAPKWDNYVAAPTTGTSNIAGVSQLPPHIDMTTSPGIPINKGYGSTAPKHPNSKLRSESLAPNLNRYSALKSDNSNIASSFGGSPNFRDSFGPKGGFRRRAYSEVDRNPRNGIFNTEHSPFDEEDEDDDNDEDSSVYMSSNPSSRRGSETSSIDDVCLPVDTVGDSGKQKSWPNIEVLEEFAREEAQNIKKVNEASAAMSQNSSIVEPGEGVNFQYPLVSNIDQGDSLTEPLLRSKEEETDLINGRLRPPKLTPWDSRHDSFRARQAMLGKFRFTYFREDLPETIHSPNISGLAPKDGMTFADLFSPSYYGPKVPDQRQNSFNPDSMNNPVRDSNPQLQQVNSKLSRIGTTSSTPTPSVGEFSRAEKQDIPPFWLDVYNPNEDEMKVLSKAFGIHPLTTEDIFLGEAREKVELFKDYYFVCFTSFDVAQEHHRQKAIERAHALSALEDEEEIRSRSGGWVNKVRDTMGLKHRKKSLSDRVSSHGSTMSPRKSIASISSRRDRHSSRKDELIPLNMYIIVFRDGVITFHFRPTPHPGNVRRRARLLRDYLTVSSDWIGYALVDDITDAFAPLIESIETEVNSIEDQILVMQSGDTTDSDDSSDESDDEDHIWVKLKRRSSTVGVGEESLGSSASSRSSTSSSSTKIIGWKRKGDMLRRIGECRRRVMSLLRLLGSKPDVIKGFAKRCNEQWQLAPKSEIGLYLGDIQDHVVTMVQTLNHFEKVLARSHSNYLAQINIDMSKANNDMNDILGKITILGTIVLPLNIITGLWGMNCLVPGQDIDNLNWFWGILAGMMFFGLLSYLYAKQVSGIV